MKSQAREKLCSFLQFILTKHDSFPDESFEQWLQLLLLMVYALSENTYL